MQCYVSNQVEFLFIDVFSDTKLADRTWVLVVVSSILDEQYVELLNSRTTNPTFTDDWQQDYFVSFAVNQHKFISFKFPVSSR